MKEVFRNESVLMDVTDFMMTEFNMLCHSIQTDFLLQLWPAVTGQQNSLGHVGSMTKIWPGS